MHEIERHQQVHRQRALGIGNGERFDRTRRRAGIVGDQDVGGRTGREQGGASLRRIEVGRHGDHVGKPSAMSLLAACSSAAPSRPLSTTRAPSRASARAQANPRPRLEAQTIARFSASKSEIHAI